MKVGFYAPRMKSKAQRKSTKVVASKRPRLAAEEKKTGESPASKGTLKASEYLHLAKQLSRPTVGEMSATTTLKAPARLAYDSSLDPELQWDSVTLRDRAERLLHIIECSEDSSTLKAAATELRSLSKPFLNWSGKKESQQVEVSTAPLFVHERLSTSAIIGALTKRQRIEESTPLGLRFHGKKKEHDGTYKAYEHRDEWVNRMILGDSLTVMNSLLHYEGLGNQVATIFIDPPYGISFGSNFQPFVRQSGVSENNDDKDLTREPSMVQAYRDTWKLGVHSYLTYLRDRLTLARELLASTGSIFVQIGDENQHLVRMVLDEVFGSNNYIVTILFKKKGSQKGSTIKPVNDYILWFAKNIEEAKPKIRNLYEKMEINAELGKTFRMVELADGTTTTLVKLSKSSPTKVNYAENPKSVARDFPGSRLFTSENITSGGNRRTQSVIFEYQGNSYDPGIAKGNCWKHSGITDDGSPSGMHNLAVAGRLYVGDTQLRFKRFIDDFGYTAMTNWWDGLGGASDKTYVVQTNIEVVKRCILMTTEPGDLVFDPTCGSGTTAIAAEQWGRRWITCDVSRVPLALARQRVLTATYPWFSLAFPEQGPIGGFNYSQKIDKEGRHVGGIVPYVTSSTFANNEKPAQKVLVDRPDVDSQVTRVSGPFFFEASVPSVLEISTGNTATESHRDHHVFIQRMFEILKANPTIMTSTGSFVTLQNIRRLLQASTLVAEATLHEQKKKTGIVFGPINANIGENYVMRAVEECQQFELQSLMVIGFAIEPNARLAMQQVENTQGISCLYVQATPDLAMSDLLKTTKTSQLFSVCGLPELQVQTVKGAKEKLWTVTLDGLDTFDAATMKHLRLPGEKIPAWFLDTDYDGTVFHVDQAFFPKQKSWENLKKELKGLYDNEIWALLRGTTSAPFTKGKHSCIAVKVIDDRGNELTSIAGLAEARQ